MSSRSTRRQATERKKTTPLSAVKSAALWLFFLFLLTALVAFAIVYKHGGEQLYEAVSSVFQSRFPSLETSFGSIRLDAARGIRLNDVVWKRPDQTDEDTPLFEAEEIYVSCPIDFNSLVQGTYQPRKIVLIRPRFYADSNPQFLLEDLQRLQPAPSDSEPCEIEIVDATLEITKNDSKEAKKITGINATFTPKDPEPDVSPDEQPTPEETSASGNTLATRVVRPQAKQTRSAEYTARDSRVRIRSINYEERLDDELVRVSDESQQKTNATSTPWTIEATVSNPYVESLKIAGEIDSTSWSASGTVDKLDLGAILDLIGEYTPVDLSVLNALQGKTSLDFAFSGDINAPKEIQYKIEGTALNCALTTPVLKYPLSEIEMLYVADNNYASVEKFTAHCGLTRIDASYAQQGSLTSPDVAWFQGRLDNLPLDDVLLKNLVADAQNKKTIQADKANAILKFIGEYQFSATTNVEVAVEKNANARNEWEPTRIEITGKDVEFTYQDFPYKVDRLIGKVALDSQGSLTIALRSSEEAAPLSIDGLFINALTRPRGQVDVVAKNRAIDARLLAATPQSCRSTLTQLHPSGEFDAKLRMTYDPERFPRRPFRIETCLDVRDGSVQYDRFPLPITSITGSLYMRDGAWIFNGLSGKSGAANLVASGSIASGALIEEITAEITESLSRRNAGNATTDGIPYRLNIPSEGAEFSDEVPLVSPAPVDLFAALPVPVNAPLKKDARRFQLSTNVENFPLGEELRAALVKYDKKEEFEKLNLIGKADGQIRVAYRTDTQKLALEFEMRPTAGSTSARPEGFPYEFRDVEGLFVYREGAFIVEGLRARNGRMTLSADVSSQTVPDRGWILDLNNLRVDQVQIDRDLQSAAPNQALSILSFLNLTGSFNVDGKMRIIKGTGAQAKPQALWNLRLIAQQNAARPGVQLDAICGSIKLIGCARENESPEFFGEFNLDSLYFNDLQVANLNGPFYFDGSDLFWGKEAPTVQRTPLYQDAFLRTMIDADPMFQASKLTFIPENPWRKIGGSSQRNGQTLTRAQVQNQSETPGFNAQEEPSSMKTLTASNDGRRTLQARIFGGYFACDGVFNMRETQTYRLNASLHEGTLDDATRYFAPGNKPLKGRISARASLMGEGASLATLKGEGDLDVQDAELYELPQIVKMFQILSVKDPEQAAFNSLTVKYDVLGDRLKLTNVLLRGDAMTLFGEGWLTIKGQEKLIDLTLNSRLGNPSTQIPVVSDLIGEVGDQITQIRVEGNVKSPVIHQEAAPGVKKAWWNVFPEREPEPTDKAPVERARPIRDAWKKMTGTKKE